MKKHISILCALMGVFALAGCNNPLTGAKTQGSGASGVTGAVAVTIQMPEAAGSGAYSATARTLYPASLGVYNFSRYELSFSDGPATHEPVELDIGNSPTIALAVGSWTITVTAYNAEAAAARGSAAVEIAENATAQASITLGPVPGGANGTLSYAVTVPAGAEGSLTVWTTTGGVVAQVTLAAETNEDTLDLPSGEYLLFISLDKNGNHAGQTEALHIYSGLTSEASCAFTEDDFIAAQTLNPIYEAAFTGEAGAILLPSNTAEITEAQGGNTAVFAIVDDDTSVAMINSGTGELTLIDSGSITVSLTITTASGVVTHQGTSASIVVTRLYQGDGGITVIPPTIPEDAVIDLTGPAAPVVWRNGTITASVDNYEEFTGSGSGSYSEVFTGSYSGADWAVQGDGRRKSPTIGHSQTTKTRYDFTTASANARLVIQLYVSSESGYDYAFVGNLDSTASLTSYYDRISDSTSKTITISVPTAGSHFIEIGYGKDSSQSSGSDCAWFTLAQQEISAGEISWYLDGALISGQTSAVLAVNASNYALGTHRLTVIATKSSDGKSYSKSVNFTIVKE
jgi:hypothetical protein